MDNSHLERCSALYEEQLAEVGEIERQHGPEIALAAIERLARFAWEIPTGRFADGRLENIAFRLGQSLQLVPEDSSMPAHEALADRSDTRRKVLHVVTTVLGVGGHTKLVANWIEKDPDSRHIVLLTNQRSWPIPEWLQEVVLRNGGGIISLPAAEILVKASWLRRLVQDYAPLVVLHHHPNDAIPVVAFAVDLPRPVAIMNHADHVFWMGTSVAGAVIDFRLYGPTLSRTRRFARASLFLPLPLAPGKEAPDRDEARRELGIPADQVMLLSIGQAYKYTPTATHNFYAAAVEILDANPTAHIYLIGVSADAKREQRGASRHERLHLLGVIENPSLYRAAADLYLESYPLASLTAMLETSMLGVCPVPCYAPTSRLLVSDDIALEGVAEHTPTEREYVENVSALIRDPGARSAAGRKVREQIEAYHMGGKWYEDLAEVYHWLDTAAHHPEAIPAGDYEETRDDVALSHLSEKVYDPAYLVSWSRRLTQCAVELETLIPAPDRLILADEYQFEGYIAPGRVIPFLEKDGAYAGPPSDDAEAIRELERLLLLGPTHLVFGWPAFWWLEHYAKFGEFVRSRFPCVLQNDRLIVFSLGGSTAG